MADITTLAEYDSDEESPFAAAANKKVTEAVYANLDGAGFVHFQLKEGLIKAIGEAGFEHPSQVQTEVIPQAVLGTDILCQAKSGMGKTAVFVLSLLHQIQNENHIQAIVVAHTRELAVQIQKELDRFKKHLDNIRTQLVVGGVPYSPILKAVKSENKPHILVGSPGTLLRLAQEKEVDLSHVKHFVIDECDQIMESLDFRKTVQDLFRKAPVDKQVMMFSATLSEETHALCKRFMRLPHEIVINDGAKLKLDGLHQYFVTLAEKEKLKKLISLLDEIQFNQVMIFVSTVKRARMLNQILRKESFPSSVGFGPLSQKKRTEVYNNFKEVKCPILISTDMFARGIDFERVNLVINFDMPRDEDVYLHRVGRAGRFGTKGITVSFVTTPADQEVLTKVRAKFAVELPELPATIDPVLYK